MTDLFVRLHLFLARQRLGVLALVGLFAAGALLLSRRLQLNEDFTQMLPLSEPAIAEQVQALKRLRQADRLFVDVQTAALDPGRLGQAADAMHAALAARPDLRDLRYNVEETDFGQMLDQWRAQLPRLLTANELRQLEGRLQAPAVSNRLAWLKQAMSQPQGLMFKQLAQTDPAGLGDALTGRLRALQAGVADARLVAGRITSADGRHALISAVPGFRPSELRPSAALLAGVLKAARDVEAQFPAGSVRVAVTGAHRVALDNARMIEADSTRTSVLATIGVAALMLGAYRRRWLALLGLTPTVFGALGAVTAFYLAGDPVSAIALGCGSILIGVTVDYGIYVLYRADDSPPPDRQSLAEAVARLTPTISFGALTTMAAFVLMFLSPVSGHRQLGLFGAVSVAVAAVFALLILPLLVPVGPAGSARALPLTALMQRVFAWRARRWRTLFALLLVFSGLCVLGLARLRFEGDLARLNGVTPETRRDEETLKSVWGKALSLTTVVVSGANREEALQKNERVYAALRQLQDKRVIAAFSSIAPLVPSERAQRANLRDWRAFWTATRQRDLSDSLAAAASALGFRPGAFAPFLAWLAAPAEPPPPAAPGTSPATRLLGDYWSDKEGCLSVSTLVKAPDRQSYRRLRQAVLAEVPDALLLNQTALADEITRVARRALPLFAALVAVCNAALLFVLLGRLALVLITLLPMAAGVFWTLGTLGLLGWPIDMSNFIFVVLVIGVGGDYSLFLVTAELEPLRGYRERTAATGGAVTVCALTTLLGVGALALARHPSLFSVGLTALLGISLSLLATLLLVPPCMEWLRRRAASCAEAAGGQAPASVTALRRQIGRRYRYQGPYVTQFVFWKTRTDPLFRAVDAAVPPTGAVLDLGCGYGMVAHWLTLAAPGRTVLGADGDADRIRVARATAGANPRVAFEHRDLLSWDYPACGHVLLCDVLHYFPRELKAAVLRKAFAALRPGGLLVLREACQEDSWRHRLVALSERWSVWLGQNKTAHGLHFESAEDYRALLEQAGFTQIQLHEAAGLGSNQLLVARKGNPASERGSATDETRMKHGSD
jgi:predicted exporter/SAM-dependent methyltransferase